jgi:hypothetical protein
MNTTILTILLVFACISGFGGILFIGLDIKKWWVWLFGLGGFLSGLFIGLLRSDLVGGLKLGGIFTCMTIFGGLITRMYRLRYKEK